MATSPSERHTTIDEFAQDLEACTTESRHLPKRRWLIAALVLVAVSFSAWRMGWFDAEKSGRSSTTNTARESVPFVGQQKITLSVRVWETDKYFNLADVVPLENGDELQVRASVTPGLHASLFLFTSDGKLKLLASTIPSDTVQTLYYPADVGQVVPLRGPAGTEFLLVCASEQGPISVDEIQSMWDDSSRWPKLPDMLVLRVGLEGVEFEQRGRDLGPPSDLPNPETIVIERLENLQEKLSKRFRVFDGIAFAHRE